MSGPWGSLSIVTGAFPTVIVTKSTTALLNDQGESTGRQIAGATTITLTDEQRRLAGSSASLWIQGGTPTDPDPRRRLSGSIRVRGAEMRDRRSERRQRRMDRVSIGRLARVLLRLLRQAAADERHDRRAQGGLASGGRDRVVPVHGEHHLQSQPAVRARRHERGARLDDVLSSRDRPRRRTVELQGRGSTRLAPSGIDCVSKTGASATTTNLQTAATAVTLAAGDVVTCTYTDSQTPPVRALALSKVSFGGWARSTSA